MRNEQMKTPVQASPTLTLIRIIGVIVCFVVSAVHVVRGWAFGAQIVPYIHGPSGRLARFLAGLFTDNAAARQALALWLIMGIGLLLVLIFAAAFLVRTSPSGKRSAMVDNSLLALQIVIALIFDRALLYIVALELALVLPRRSALAWLGAQMVAMIAVMITFMMFPPSPILMCHVSGVELPSHASMINLGLGMDLAWQVFAFCIGYIASAEKRSRVKLAGTHAELLATQQRLADALRASERVRIARSLHDAIGRHLGTLNAHLECAAEQAGSHAIASIDTSRELAQRLSAQVSVVVSAESMEHPIDLRQTLGTLCAGIPFPRVALSFDDALEINSPSLAHTIFCAIQEAITNAVRHSGAAVLHIALSKEQDGILISISDNGKGAAKVDEGNGLRGIRERVEELGGTLSIGKQQRAGFNLRIWLPPGAAS